MKGPDHVLQDSLSEDGFEMYEAACASDADRTEWVDSYSKNPIDFFSDENIDKLKSVDSGKRMLWFSLSLRDLRVTPEIAKKYFEIFPTDLSVFKNLIEFNRLPSNTREFNIWAICSGLIEDAKDISEVGKRRPNQQYLDIGERRNLAPKQILSNYSHDIFDKMTEFGPASENFFIVFDKANANPMGLDEVVETDSMFSSDEYNKLETQKKLEFLQLCLSGLQYSLVFHETNNSAFTAEGVKRYGKDSKYHNVAHSMLYGTYQPSYAYNLAQADFDYEMNSTASIGGSVEEYPFHRMLLQTLREISKIKDTTPKTTELLVEFWDKNRNPIFANSVTESIISQDVNIGAHELLSRIKGDSSNKNALTAILYRLEFGKLGISKKGVRYLERIYDLGEANNPDYFVSRLTAQGDIGIFGNNSELLKHFNLGDLSTDEKLIKTAVYDFVYETLFIAPANETYQMRAEREKYLQEFKGGYFDFQKEDIFTKSELHLNNLSFKEQGWLFTLWQKADEQEKLNLVQFAKNFEEGGIKLFLLLNERGEGFRQNIFKMVDRFGVADAQKVFGQVSKILNQINEVDEWVLKAKEEMPKPQAMDDITFLDRRAEWEKAKRISDSGLVQKIQVKMIGRVQKLLENENLSDILKNLSNISAEAVLAQSMILSNREGDNFSINDLPDMALYTGENYTIHDKEAKKIREIYKANYKDRPKMLERLLQGFEESRKKENAEFHTMYFKDELVGVVVFEYDGDQVYFGKFNIDPKFQGGKIGEQIMDETLDVVAQDHIITATCSKGAPITPKYIERGFVAEGEFQFEEDACFNIVRNDSKNDLFISKSFDEDFIIDHSQLGHWTDFEDSKCKVLLTKANGVGERMFPQLSKNEDGSKWVMTRFFKVPSTRPEDDMVCYVMEKVKDTDFEEYKSNVDHSRPYITRSAIII